MNELWGIFAVALVAAFLIRNNDLTLQERYGYKKNDHLFTFLLIVMLSLFCGLRTGYNDTGTYRLIYQNTKTLSDFLLSEDADFAHGIGFAFVNSAMKSVGFSEQDFIMSYALVTTTLYIKFLRRYSVNPLLSVFLLFTTGAYTFTLAAIKQSIAMGICLTAIPYLAAKRRVSYIAIILLASLFHPYALIYLLALFMDFRPWHWQTYISIFVFVGCGLLMDKLIGALVDITSIMGADYTSEMLLAEGVNIIRVLVVSVPVLLSMPYKKWLFHDSSRAENILFNLVMLNALIMFVGLFGTGVYFGRLANYFLPMQMVVIPWMLRKIGGKDSQFLTICCVAGYIGYFMYGNLIMHRFDDHYSRTTFWNYILSHYILSPLD